MTITREQIKAARNLLGWSQQDVAGHIGVSKATIGNFEKGKRRPEALQASMLRSILERAGVEFTNDEKPGVRLAGSRESPERAAKDLLQRPGVRRERASGAHSGVSDTTLALFETGKRRLSVLDVSGLRRVLEAAGIEFTDPCVRLASRAEDRERSAKDYL